MRTKAILLIGLFLCYLPLVAQIQFEEVLPQPPLSQIKLNFHEASVYSGTINFSDIDNDGDEDVLITGINFFPQFPVTKLYKNNGNGNFTKIINTAFVGIRNGSVKFSDIDNDGDQDLFMTGRDSNLNPISKLYKNDGLGNFTEITTVNITSIYQGDIEFSDVDNDGDNDLFISGRINSSQGITKLYVNDGLGHFTEDMNNSFLGVTSSAIGLSDIDNDGDFDLLITGDNANLQYSKLYENDGFGNFTENTNVVLTGVRFGSLEFADVNDDGYEDLLIIGQNSSALPMTSLYINDTNGGFIAQNNSSFEGLQSGHVNFSDVDNDGDKDIFLTGTSVSSNFNSFLYQNDGNGIFTEVSDTPMMGASNSYSAFSDMDEDGDLDLLVCGSHSPGKSSTEVYMNDGLGNYFEITSTPLYDVNLGSSIFIDIENDGDQDIILSGVNYFDDSIVTKIFENNGNGIYNEIINPGLEGVFIGSLDAGDVNGDGFDDVLLTGVNSANQRLAKLYANSNGTFNEISGLPFEPVKYSDGKFSDLDNDGDLDIVIIGFDNIGDAITKLYWNDGSGNYTEDNANTFIGIYGGSMAIDDINGDGTNDIVISGINNASDESLVVYNNNGNGSFSLSTNTNVDPIQSESIYLSDIDNDGDKDLFVSGLDENALEKTVLYENNGNGSFNEVFGTPFPDVSYTSLALTDVDNDGDDDLFMSGLLDTNTYSLFSKLYENDGNGNFTEISGLELPKVISGTIAFEDIDDDSDMDLLVTGQNENYVEISKLYRNTTNFMNNTEFNNEYTNVLLYPNPAKSEASILTSSSVPINDISIRIFDALGNKIDTLISIEKDCKLDVSLYSTGIYLLKIKINNSVIINKKLIIE